MGYSTPWSYSKLSLYKKCPAAFKYRYIDKIKTPMSDAAKRGVEIHERLGAFVIGPGWDENLSSSANLERCPPYGNLMAKYGISKEFCSTLCELRLLYNSHMNESGTSDAVQVEAQVKVDENWGELPDDRRDYWATFIYDLVVFGDESNLPIIIDFKTGKYYETHKDQAAYYALSFWRVTGVIPHVAFFYMDQGDTREFNFTAEELEAVEVDIRQTLQEIESDNTFACCSSGRNCGWCDFRKQGLCR